MIALDRLDYDIDRWEQELVGLERSIDPQSRRQFQTLAEKLSVLRKENATVDSMIEQSRLAESTEVPMAPVLRAILFWARELGDRIEDFSARYADYLEKLLWLNLLRGRLLGQTKPFQLDLGEGDIQQMLKRKQSLEKSEQLISQELRNLQEREQELRVRYESFQYEEAVRQASQSFAAPARSLSTQRTAFDAFGRLLRTMAAHTAHEPSQVKRIQKMTVNFTRRSQSLMEDCGELLRQGMGLQGPQRSKSLRLMQENLSELRRLESEIDTSLIALTPDSGRRKSSFLVKKFGKQAKTIRLSHPE